MAKALAYQRSSQQPVTIDTVAGVVNSLGNALVGQQTTSLFPARCTNLHTTLLGDSFQIGLNALGRIEVRRLVSGTWTLVAGPYSPASGHTFSPLCMHIVNNTLVAMWSDLAAGSDGIRYVTSTDGASWSAIQFGQTSIPNSFGGHSIVYRTAIWFATSSGLWALAPLARFISIGAVVGSPFVVGDTITGSVSLTTAVVRFVDVGTLHVDTVSGSGFINSETLTGGTSGATTTITSVTSFVNTAPDTGNDLGLGDVTGLSNLIGCFANWDGVLYFLQPKTVNGPTRLYQLAPAWDPRGNFPSPQWTVQAISGFVDVGFASVSNDAGMWTLFSNNNDELCMVYSGSVGTKMAKAVSKTFPLIFTDLTISLLPLAIANLPNLGITLFDDDRRRANNLQTLLFRDSSNSVTYLCLWDGTNPVNFQATLTGSDFMLPANRRGEESTFTNLSPAVEITGTSQPFPGRVRIDYILRCSPAHPCDVIPEFSIDGYTFFPMSEGDGDSGSSGLPTSPIGRPYFFFWDAFTDLQGDFPFMNMRILARISGV